ncbi:hypothetical protein NHJ13734_009327 [Beauveria thailandica]
MKSSVLILLASSAGSFAAVHVDQSFNASFLPARGFLARSRYIPFCGGQKRATPAQVAYARNTGTEERYGCNMMLIPADIASLYKYTIDPDGGINGFFAGNEAITFGLAASGPQFVAFNENSQIGCACHAGSVPLTPFSEFASTWVEADFGNESNQKRSGFDASCLVAAQYGLHIPGLSVCGGAPNTCSTIYPGGAGDNAYVKGMEDMDIVAPIVPGPVALTVKVDIV